MFQYFFSPSQYAYKEDVDINNIINNILSYINNI